MFKKIVISLVFVVTLLFGAAGSAQAADNAPPDVLGGRLTYGQVVRISIQGFAVQTRGGATHNYLVDESTRYRSTVVQEPSFESLTVGDPVGVAARPVRPGQGPGSLVARLVLIVSPDFDPSLRFGIRVRGEVLGVELEKGIFSLVKANGEEMIFQVDERTRYVGQVQTLGDLKPGWVVGVAGGAQEDGTNLVAIVAAAEQPRRVVVTGDVTAIAVHVGTFDIETRQGDAMTFLVDDNTAFHSREQAVSGLGDLQPGMVTGVTAMLNGDGEYLAKRVVAANRDALPHFEIKARGGVISIGIDSFAIQTPEGEAITFNVDDQTRFLGPGGQRHSLADLRLGMRLLVGGDELETGALAARLVLGR